MFYVLLLIGIFLILIGLVVLFGIKRLPQPSASPSSTSLKQGEASPSPSSNLAPASPGSSQAPTKREVPELTAAYGEAVLRARKEQEEANTIKNPPFQSDTIKVEPPSQPEIVIETPKQRRAQRYEPTIQISANELQSLFVEEEGTTLGIDLREASRKRSRISLQSEYDLSVEFSIPTIDEEPVGPASPIRIIAGGATDVGRKRKHNEDAFAIDEERSLYIIADGMGGYAAGEVASQMCVEAILRAYRTNHFGGQPIPGLPPRADELIRAIQLANLEILTESRTNEARAGMGTTVVAMKVVPKHQRAYIAHVGDSRLYRLRGDELLQITADHTLGALGVTGPAAHKLSRAVGVFDEVEVDLNIDVPQAGDIYLLCSDGLFKMVHELRIVEILKAEKEPQAAANALIMEANLRGGKDNISAIVLHVHAAGKDSS
ncbi:MAG: protein phosphatase 2C domain-containing protein [Sandaracinaceae bacterium]|nr:protein phosphatase 2C domain-containing protein [Sandaracinaceae bacterium]